MEESSYSIWQVSNRQAKRFDPVNRCIYCQNGKPPFSKEHIIPKGIGGGLILPRASCSICQKEINKIETYCLRGPFLSFRLATGLVQNLSDLGSTKSLPMKIDGKETLRYFSVDKFPRFLVLPAFTETPNFFRQGPVGYLMPVRFDAWGDHDELRALHEEGETTLIKEFNMDYFARLLAKIAHGFACAYLNPWDDFDPLLPPLILGNAPEQAAYLLGAWNDDRYPLQTGVLHQIGWRFLEIQHRMLLSVRLRLFAVDDTIPAYQVLVGFLAKPFNQAFARHNLTLAPHGLRTVLPSASEAPLSSLQMLHGCREEGTPILL